MGRRGDLISPNDIIRRVGIVDTEHYRQVVSSLQTKGVLATAIPKLVAKNTAKKRGVGLRDMPRFKVQSVKELGAMRETKGRNGKPVKPATFEALDVAHAFYVGNIPPNTSERDIMSAFKAYGSPESIVIPRSGGLTKGYAFIEFEESVSPDAILQAKLTLGGRHLVIRRKLPRRA